MRGRVANKTSRQTNRRKKESPHGLQDFVKQETLVIHPFVLITCSKVAMLCSRDEKKCSRGGGQGENMGEVCK